MSAGRVSVVADERGGVAPFIALLLPIFVALAGLAYDGGQLFAARREAINVAAASARAGANDVDEASIYAGEPELARTALSTAESFATAQGVDTASASRIADDEIRVEVEQEVDLLFLGVVGIGSQTVTGSADARLRQAVTAP